MNKIITVLIIISITLLLLVGIRYWAFNPITKWPFSYLSADEPDYEIVNRFFPFHIINPKNITSDSTTDLISKWQIRELGVRTLLLILIWLIIVILTLKIRKHLTNRCS